MENLVSLSDPSEWKVVLKQYPVVLKEIANKKTKKGAGKELLILDKWFQKSLPDILSARDPMFMTSEELVQLMKWKLSRGKFRPRLVELAASNESKVVESTTKSAFQSAREGELATAIKTLSALKGIGPATASAVLAAGHPQEVPFMADESVWGILGRKSLKYNLSEYLSYVEGIANIKRRLIESDTDCWTAHEVELCLWTHHHAQSLGLVINNKTKTRKRKCTDEKTVAKKKK